jgi:hypothetical protein
MTAALAKLINESVTTNLITDFNDVSSRVIRCEIKS